jgi:sulfate/thiosulfate transport system substrate-binding protein
MSLHAFERPRSDKQAEAAPRPRIRPSNPLFASRLVQRSALLAALSLLTAQAYAGQTILNVSYDPTRELYKAVDAAFVADWKAKAGETVAVQASHGGSGAQARAVIDGLDADVVTLALAADIDAIAAKTAKIPADWQKRLPHNSAPYTSTIVLLVRKGNPKGIHDWDDLAKPGISVVTPNPKTSGGARWNFLAAWGYGMKKFGGDEAKTKAFVAAIYRNAPVLDTGARGSTITFAQRGIGDVLIAWENEAFLASAEFGKDQFEIITPSISILAEPPIALVDGNVDAKGTRKVAEAYLNYLYTPAAQAIIARNYFRPSNPESVPKADLARFPKIDLITVDNAFGGWKKAQAKYFADGGVFDQIVQSLH